MPQRFNHLLAYYVFQNLYDFVEYKSAVKRLIASKICFIYIIYVCVYCVYYVLYI